MSDDKTMGQVIQIDEARIRDHLGEMVRGTVEEALNALCRAQFRGLDRPFDVALLPGRLFARRRHLYGLEKRHGAPPRTPAVAGPRPARRTSIRPVTY